jgi:hypothetical protein
MTLFIACLLLYHYGMEWPWYLLAVFLWLLPSAFALFSD